MLCVQQRLREYMMHIISDSIRPECMVLFPSQLGGADGMGNFIQHMGKWRADTHYISNKAWDWTVDDRGKDSYSSAAWTDSAAFHESLFGNATEW